MAQGAATGRWRQKHRTRRALLDAAASLMKSGRTPGVEEVADEALVSRATAYRYFPSIEALLLEAALDVAVPDAHDLFEGVTTTDPVRRLNQADAALDRMIRENEAPLRLMLANSLRQKAMGRETDTPVRQNRRTLLIEAALAPSQKRFDPADFERLKAALALVIGAEAMVVFRDVLQLDEARAQDVRRWAIRALVAAALATPSSEGNGQ